MQQYRALGINFLVILGGTLLTFPLAFGICHEIYTFGDKVGCSDDSIANFGWPILLFGLAVLPTSFFSPFIKKTAGPVLKKFATWWLPLSIVVVSVSSVNSGTWMPLYFLNKSQIALSMGVLFTLISLLLIVLKIFKKNSG